MNTIERNGRVQFVRDGKETRDALSDWDADLPKTVATAAVLAVQGE